MNLFSKLRTLDRPITLALIGAGKFGTMFLAQVLRTPGIHLAGIADRRRCRARQSQASRLAGRAFRRAIAG